MDHAGAVRAVCRSLVDADNTVAAILDGFDDRAPVPGVVSVFALGSGPPCGRNAPESVAQGSAILDGTFAGSTPRIYPPVRCSLITGSTGSWSYPAHQPQGGSSKQPLQSDHRLGEAELASAIAIAGPCAATVGCPASRIADHLETRPAFEAWDVRVAFYLYAAGFHRLSAFWADGRSFRGDSHDCALRNDSRTF
jgi:hypothetical protein